MCVKNVKKVVVLQFALLSFFVAARARSAPHKIYDTHSAFFTSYFKTTPHSAHIILNTGGWVLIVDCIDNEVYFSVDLHFKERERKEIFLASRYTFNAGTETSS
jgi:hypothetical protein